MGTDKLFVAMVGFVFGGFCEDGHKGMNSAQLVVGDDHEERKQCTPDGEQVVVGWFPVKGGEGVIGLIVVKYNYSRARGVFFRMRGAGRVP